MQPAAINDDIMTEADIDLVVWGMKGGGSGGPSGMRAEDLKGWRKEANHEKDPEGRRWDMLLRLVQVMFRDGTVPVKRLEGAKVGFLQQVTRKQATRLRDGSWGTVTEKSPTGSRDTAAPDICVQETGNSGGVGGPTDNF